MAMTDAERQQRYAEKKKRLLGEEEFKRLKHEAYQRRKEKLAITRELEEIKKRGGTDRLYLFYLGVRLGLYLEKSRNGLINLTPEQQEEINLRALDAAQQLSDEGNIEKVAKRWTRAINMKPALGTQFFMRVANLLKGKEKDVWDFVYLLLLDCDSETEKHTTAYIIEVETGVPSKTAHKTLLHLADLKVIKYREENDPKRITILQEQVRNGVLPSIYDALSVFIKQGDAWNEDTELIAE